MGGLRNGLNLAKKGQELKANSEQPMESMIIFLTDGQPNFEESDPDKITENVEILNNRVTIFTLGFGYDADMKFLKKLSLVNRGFARRIYEDSDASIQLQNFYKEVASPVLSDIKFEYLPDQVENVTSKSFKNLFSGSDILVMGKVKPNGNIDGALTAKAQNGPLSYPIPVCDIIILPKEENRTLGHLEKMWAYKTIKSLIDKNTISKNESIESKAKELALKYSFVTPLTSLVVVKPNDSGVISDEESSGNRRGPFFGYPVSSSGGAPGSSYMPMASMPAQSPIFTGGVPPPSFGPFPSTTVAPYYPHAPHYPNKNDEDGNPPRFETTTTQPQHNEVPYQNVTWLNQTASEDGYLIPPSSLQTTDVIALNQTNVISSSCVNGSPCRHFIFCALAEFADDVSKFLPFKCHIETKFLGVCCPF